MFNSQRPRLEDLPTTRQLLAATGAALAASAVILGAVVLPSEYGIDPTGIGGSLGLTQMGEIKVQLAQEAAADAANGAAAEQAAPDVQVVAQEASPEATAAGDAAGRSDTTQITLAPGEGAEIKLVALSGARIAYDWSVAGGHVNYDTHADAPGISYHGYDKGQQSTGEQGELVAAFDGSHGWFWRNRSTGPVTVTLRTHGAYSEVKRVV